MMRPVSILAVALLAGVATPALADAVAFAPMPAGEVADIVRAAVGDVSGVETATIDLNGDKSNEIFVRLTGDCDAANPSACRTIVLRLQADKWISVLDTKAAAIETGVKGFGGMSSIVADQRTWTYSGQGYHVDLAGSGTPIEFSLASAEYVELLAQQFGDGALTLFREQSSMKVHIAAVDLTGAGANEIAVKLEGPGVCGVVYGCPWRVLQVHDGAYKTLLQGSTSGTIAILPVDRGGWKDIASEIPNNGLVTYGWDGSQYGVADFVKGSKS